MKRLLMPLLLCACLTSFTGCSEPDPDHVIPTDLMGCWSNDVTGGNLEFTHDGKFQLNVNVSSILTIDGNGIAHLPEMDADYSQYCSYDGSTFSFNIKGTDMLTMQREGEPSPNNAYGQYKLISGILYDQFSQGGDSADAQYYAVVKPDNLTVNALICEYVCDYDTVIFTGTGLADFTGSDNNSNKFSYTVKDDKLTLKNNDETLIFDKVYND